VCTAVDISFSGMASLPCHRPVVHPAMHQYINKDTNRLEHTQTETQYTAPPPAILQLQIPEDSNSKNCTTPCNIRSTNFSVLILYIPQHTLQYCRYGFLKSRRHVLDTNFFTRMYIPSWLQAERPPTGQILRHQEPSAIKETGDALEQVPSHLASSVLSRGRWDPLSVPSSLPSLDVS
jgi:hypothetical protein